MTDLNADMSREALHEALLERAKALASTLAERAPHTDSLRRVPEETIADLGAAQFFRMLQPRRWGGLEVHPNTFFDVQTEVASACPSTAWVLGVVAVHAWQLALFDPKAQDDVWGRDTATLISSSYAPTGKVTRVEGGFRISGRWSFSSGSDHCQWVFLGGFAPTEGGPPDMRTFLLPRSDYTIDDNWHVVGLRGTGSKDIVVDNAFVPEHRTHKMSDGFRCDNPGNQSNPSALYRIPFGQIFVRSVSTSAIGILQGALAFYRSVTATKVGAADGNRAAQDPAAMMVTAQAAATLGELKLVLHRNFDQLIDAAERGERVDVNRRVAMRFDSSEAVRRAAEAVDRMFAACGGRALFLSSPMHRYFVDVHAAQAHYANRPDKPGQNLGRTLLGGKTVDYFI
jgi:3-hydroxy-9,10-secoandrosta-1,3,5(10)-triene-9,17-dione monooxygenase